MKKSIFFAACTIALVACSKPDPIKVTADYEARTFLSIVKQSGVFVEGVPSAGDYFSEQIKNFNDKVLFSATFLAEDKTSSELAYGKTDEEASRLVSENRAKAEEILNGIQETLKKKDVGSGNYTCDFVYAFGRSGKTLDQFESEIVYEGGDRLLSEPVSFVLAGRQSESIINVKFTGIDTEIANTLTCSNDIKVCLPDDTFADSSTFGKVAEIIEVTKNEEEGCFYLQLLLSAGETQMANFKANAGKWHLLVPATANSNDDTYDFVIYMPVEVKDSGK